MVQALVPADLGSATLAGWLEAIVTLDAQGWPLLMIEAADPRDPLDSLSVAAFLASRTSRIGLGVVADAAQVEPFTLARGLASLAHLSQGRVAWRLIGDIDGERLLEHAEVTARLLASWDLDAPACDHDAGLFSRSEAVRPVHHHGPHYTVRGPLNIPQPRDGVPPRFALAADPAAAGADLLLAPHTLRRLTLAEAAALPPPPAATGVRLRDRLETIA
ncbi:LLM class flavin-dependent oxidoreductase [Polymorphobacter sp.]|uniref:LLM class flavin-dependent oxidoreductase n=1 Tax=Polymorphobacter sp. TaxID=1909290 RepID=UPI003F72F762